MYSIKQQQRDLPVIALITMVSHDGKIAFTSIALVVPKPAWNLPAITLLADHEFLPGLMDGRVCHEATHHQAKT